jgi:tetratricopeptide (TPR) repeat protein
MKVRITLIALVLLAGCAGPTAQGRAALGRGSYDEAARHFEEGLTREPGRPSDLIGLGIARYKLGALDDAQRALTQAVSLDASLAPAHLYLALIAIQRGDQAAADAQLASQLALGTPARLAAQIVRTRRLLAGPTLPPEMRAYIAASLEDGYQWTGEVAAAVQAANDAELRRLLDDRSYLFPYACRCR